MLRKETPASDPSSKTSWSGGVEPEAQAVAAAFVGNIAARLPHRPSRGARCGPPRNAPRSGACRRVWCRCRRHQYRPPVNGTHSSVTHCWRRDSRRPRGRGRHRSAGIQCHTCQPASHTRSSTSDWKDWPDDSLRYQGQHDVAAVQWKKRSPAANLAGRSARIGR